jgi:hypothetical protein
MNYTPKSQRRRSRAHPLSPYKKVAEKKNKKSKSRLFNTEIREKVGYFSK